jgi:HB1, ASXL, restriction endonuclease HTH domain
MALAHQAGWDRDLPTCTPPAKSRLPKMSLTDAAASLLQEAGQPLKTDDIVNRLVAGGYCPARNDRKQVVNSIYSLMRQAKTKFTRTAPGEWALAAQSTPVAGHSTVDTSTTATERSD